MEKDWTLSNTYNLALQPFPSPHLSSTCLRRARAFVRCGLGCRADSLKLPSFGRHSCPLSYLLPHMQVIDGWLLQIITKHCVQQVRSRHLCPHLFNHCFLPSFSTASGCGRVTAVLPDLVIAFFLKSSWPGIYCVSNVSTARVMCWWLSRWKPPELLGALQLQVLVMLCVVVSCVAAVSFLQPSNNLGKRESQLVHPKPARRGSNPGCRHDRLFAELLLSGRLSCLISATNRSESVGRILERLTI